MKVRDSGMPEQEYWESLLDVEGILDALRIDQSLKSVVEIGCGYGTFTVPVASRINGILYAFDIEPTMVAVTRERQAAAGLLNIAIQQRDVLAGGFPLPAGNTDAVLLFNILHAEHPVDLLRSSAELLRPGGRVLVTHWRSDVKTPRGPDMSIRPRPEQIIGWASATGLLRLEIPTQVVAPWHYVIGFSRPE